MAHTERHLLWCRRHPCQCKRDAYLIALPLAFAIAVLEAWGTYHTGSLSLFGDFWHVASDMAIYGTTLYANHLKFRDPVTAQTIDDTWGKRNSRVLTFVAGGIAIGAIYRFFVPIEIEHDTLRVVGYIGLGGNVLTLFLLWFVGTSHDHGTGGLGEHEDTTHTLASFHTMGDVLSSLLVIAVAYLPFLDWAGSLLIAGMLWMVARKTRREIETREEELIPIYRRRRP